MYEHVIKALDEQLAYQNWLLKCETSAREKAEKERDEAIKERDDLKARLAAVPATLSRADVEELRGNTSPTPGDFSEEQ